MAKNLKLNIKNTQIAKAINLGHLKDKLSKKTAKETPEEAPVQKGKEEPAAPAPKAKTPVKSPTKEKKVEAEALPKEEAPRVRARSRSAFNEKGEETNPAEKPETSHFTSFDESSSVELAPEETHEKKGRSRAGKQKADKTSDEEVETTDAEDASEEAHEEPPVAEESPVVSEEQPSQKKAASHPEPQPPVEVKAPAPKAHDEPRVKLGPTGKHISDFLPHRYPTKGKEEAGASTRAPAAAGAESEEKAKERLKAKGKAPGTDVPETDAAGFDKKTGKPSKFKEFRDIKPTRRVAEPGRTFDARDRHGFRDVDDEYSRHRKRRAAKIKYQQEDITVRPTSLAVRIPITIKDLAVAMKLKASELISKLFLHGVVVTINTPLDDETTIQLLGQELGCALTIDTTEEKRMRITEQTITEEISSATEEQLITRAPVVAFMGHVDHGKTSLIDAIRKSNRAAGEAGAITQHIGAFRCHTPVGDIAILDTPGHEAFSAMRERGAEVTDIIVLVIAGDEGIKPQTLEAIRHAKESNSTIVVALNKSDKANFNPETVYRQLADQDLLPEVWGGQLITVNCSASTGEGIQQLLEMLALQAEVLELRANPLMRARGTVLESEMHKGLGAVATVLVQNGTLKIGDSLVCDQLWGRVKTMHDEHRRDLLEAGPSTPVEITGLSGLPEAGQEFIVVKSEREAREIAEARFQGMQQKNLQGSKKISLESVFQKASENVQKKIFPVLLRADVQGSLEALKAALQKITSDKIELNVIFTGVGEVSESDVQLAAASKAVIIGFHTHIESHADSMIKQAGVQVKMHDIIYHAIDDVKALMAASLDKIPLEIEKGKAEVKATFKSSHHGLIAGCYVTEGAISRNLFVRVKRKDEVVWKGPISSLKRVKEDVREVLKGLECGILLNGYNELMEGDILEAYEVTYIAQEL